LTGGGGVNTYLYTGANDTGTGEASITVALGVANTVDIITDFKAGDRVNLNGLANLIVADAIVAVSTTYATATANQLTLVSGAYVEASRIFTAGARSAANNDYILQYNGGSTTTTVNNVVFLDTAAALASFTSAAGVLTFA